MEFAKAFDLVIVDSCFPKKKKEYLVTLQSKAVKTQIDYLLLMKCDKGLYLSENIMTHHRLLVMDRDHEK